MSGFRIDGSGNNFYQDNAITARNGASTPKAEDISAIVRPKADKLPPEIESKLIVDRVEVSPVWKDLKGVPSEKTMAMFAPTTSPISSYFVLAMANALQDDNDGGLPPIDTKEGVSDLMDFMLDYMA